MTVYSKGKPPRRGVYLTKSAGPSTNPGFRYWDGENWSILYHSYRDCAAAKMSARRRTLIYPVLWGRTVLGNG